MPDHAAGPASAELIGVQFHAESDKQTNRSSQELSVKVVEGRDVTVLNASHDKWLGVCVSLLGSKSSFACCHSSVNRSTFIRNSKTELIFATVKGNALVFQACISQLARKSGKAFQKGATCPHAEVG